MSNLNATPRKSSEIEESAVTSIEYHVVQRSVFDLRPALENDKVYRPVGGDPDFDGLVQSIRELGVQQPIVVCRDGYILSGHRRHAAATEAKRLIVPVMVNNSVSYLDDREQFVRLLPEHNRQRVKTLAEQAREAIIMANPEAAYTALIAHRQEQSGIPNCSANAIELGAVKLRKKISWQKRPMADAALEILADRRKYWPLSDRAIHYAMLNVRPPKNAKDPAKLYENTVADYDDLCDILTRLRLTGEIPWGAIEDSTRPFTDWKTFQHAGAFIKSEVDRFGIGYWRDLMQSQPNHIEVMAEKMTVQHLVQRVTQEYCIPTLIGRGFSSIPPRYELAKRFQASGKEKLIVLMLSDHDPEGEQIAHSFARSMRDDFGISDIQGIKVAITGEHVKQFNLPPIMEAKVRSSNFAKFKEKHGRFAYELEALVPATLQQLLRDAIDSVIDKDAFNREIDNERRDAVEVEEHRKALLKAMGSL